MYSDADVEKTQTAPPRHVIDREMREKRLAYEHEAQCGQAVRPMSSEEIVAELFKYHAPNELTIPKFAAINQAAKNFAEVVLANCPGGHDRATVINCIRNARMFANAAIALNGLSLY
jgi:hypothetical protein